MGLFLASVGLLLLLYKVLLECSHTVCLSDVCVHFGTITVTDEQFRWRPHGPPNHGRG